MTRNYASFADFCMLNSGGQPWALDMQRRSGNPALFAYVVSGVAELLTGYPVIQENFRRSADGVMIAEAGDAKEFAPPAMVMMALRFAKGRLLQDGQWRSDLLQVVESACPEIANSRQGSIIESGASGHWAMTLSAGKWIPVIDRSMEMGVDYARV